jgi:hypothetical protein
MTRNDDIDELATTDAQWAQQMNEMQRRLEELDQPELSLDEVGRLLDNDQEYQKWLSQMERLNGSVRTTPVSEQSSLYEILTGKKER